MLPMLPFQPDQRQIQIEGGAYPPPSPENPTLGDFRTMLRRHRILVGLCVVLTVALGGAYTLLATRVYEATSVLRFELEQVNLPQLVQQLSTENRISTEIEVLRGRSAAAAVIDSLGLRARLVVPRRGRVSDLFSVLRVAPATDTLTLVLRPGGGERSFTISRPNSRRLSSPQDATATRIGDTVRVAGVTFALTPVALHVHELRMRVVSLDEAVRGFESNLKVSRPARDADLIAARVRASEPAHAAAAANLLAHQLISGRQGLQMARTGSTVRFLRQQLDTLGIQLHVAEDVLRAYRERSGVVDAEEEARTQVRRLAQIQADRGAVEAERQALAQLVQQMRSDSARELPGGQAPSRDLISFPTLFRNQAASALLGALAQVENDRSALLVRRKPEDPDVQVLTTRIRELDAQLQGIAETYLQGLTNQVAALQEVARGFGGALDALPKKEVQTARLEREVRVQQELFTLIQTRLKEAEITQAMEDPTVRVVDPAVVPERPVRPIPLLNLALSLLLGSLLGVVSALGREMTDRSVRTRADALLAAGLPVLGAIPRVDPRSVKLLPRPSRRRRHTHHQRHKGLHRAARRLRRALTGSGRGESNGAAARIESLLVTRSETPVAYVESFNQLHANLVLAHQDRPPKVLVFTSPLPGEGKTLSSINFALTLSGRGLRVLLIDADLRCGLVNEVFGCDCQPGFAELLSGSARFEDGARRIPVGEDGALVILPAGAPVQNPGQRLSIERVREVLGALAPQFDLVLIDSPPVNILADAALLGAAADAVVLVVRAGHTGIEALRYAMDQLTAARAPVIGTLLNDIDLRRHTDDDGSYRYLVEVETYYAGRS
jgi:capsular exopolysaccharide synthesis family protein